MSTTRTLLPAVLVTAAALLIWRSALAQPASAARARPTAVAVCEVMEVLDNYERAKDEMVKLEAKKTWLENEAKLRRQKLEEKEQRLDAVYKKGSEEYRKLLNEIEEDTYNLRSWVDLQKHRGLRQHHELTRQLYEDIRQAVGALAKSRGIDVVLYFERRMPQTKDTLQLAEVMGARKVLWHDDAIDITEDVLAHLNRVYRATKPAKP
jgi:Skp family chaperone for outer membrane proteins